MRRFRVFLVALAATFALLAASVSPAGAWQHPVDQLLTYYMPGPPPGPYLSGCAVGTALRKQPAPGKDWTTLNPYSSSVSLCVWGSNRGVFYDQSAQVLVNGPVVSGTFVNTWLDSFAPTVGQPVFGSRYSAQISGYPPVSWQVAIF